MLKRLTLAIFLATFSTAHSSPLIDAIMKDLGRNRPANCPHRWCACYMNNKLKSIGKLPAPTNLSRDFAQYGQASVLVPGAIIVTRSHVSVMIGRCADGRIRKISGNWSRRVAIGCIDQRKIIAIRS